MTKVITIHPEGSVNISTKSQDNPSSSFWDILIKDHKRGLHYGAGGKVRGSGSNTRLQYSALSAASCLVNYCYIHL